MEPQTLAITILLVALGGFAVAFVIVGPGRRAGPKRRRDIPLAMRPYHSDKELETTGLERAMAWGMAFAAFCALFLAVYWVLERERIPDYQRAFYEQDVERGRLDFAAACSACHGANAGGGFAAHPDPTVDAPWPAPSLIDIAARYEENPNVTDIREFMTQTVKQGRPGTPMPAWGAAYDGPFNDQTVESVVTYLLSIQVDSEPGTAVVGASTLAGDELFAANCARCHGVDASGTNTAPDLTIVFANFGADGTEARDVQAEAAVRSTINNGRIRPGSANMPAWEGVLTADEIDRIIEFLLSVQDGREPFDDTADAPTEAAS